MNRLIMCVFMLIAASPVHAQTGACADPAMPLIELARAFDWQPSERASRRAFPALQAYLQSGEVRANREAALAYRAVLSQDPHDVHAQDALALLYAMGPDLNYPEGGIYRYTALSGYSNAAVTGSRMLRERAAADSTLWLHTIALTRLALAMPSRTLLDQAMEAVERSLRADPEHATLRLALRDLLVLGQRYEDALAVARDIRPRCVAVMHSHAEALILTRDTAVGVQLYLHALDNAGPEELHRFEDDISTIITRAQRAQFRTVPPADRAAWILSFWEHNAAASGRTIETRIVDHIQRAAWANANDRGPKMPPSSNSAISFVTDTIHRTPWSARGILYTRHGPPHRVYHAAFGRAEYEGWVYLVDDEPWTFLFSRGEDDTNRLVPADGPRDDDGAIASPMSDPEPEGGVEAPAEARTGGWGLVMSRSCLNSASFLGAFRPERMLERQQSGEPLDIREMFVAMSEFDPRFGEMARFCTIVASGVPYPPYDKLVRVWTREVEDATPHLTWRSSAVPPFSHRFRIAASAYHFRGVDGEPELVAMFWIPSSDLSAGTDAPTRSLRLTYAIVDSIIGSTRHDETLSIPAVTGIGMLGTSTVLRGDVVRRGTLRVVAVDAADSTRSGSVTAMVAPAHESLAVSMSDLVMAGSAAVGALVRGSYRVSPLPDHALEEGSTVRVFFELYGIDEEQAIETSITLTPDRPRSIRQSLGLGGADERTLSFVTASNLDVRGIAVQDFDLGGDLEPGSYFVDVTVRTDGHELTRRTMLKVLPRTR